MKELYPLMMAASLAGASVLAADPPAASNRPAGAGAPLAVENGNAPPGSPQAVANAAAAVNAPPGDVPGSLNAETAATPDTGTNCLRLNFRDASLESVLDYLSEAAGFVIVKQGALRGKVNVVSYQPVSKDEALDLLTSELDRNGYTAIRKGRVLKIINKDEAKTQGIPVRLGAEPAGIPDNDEMVTQVIPIRFVEAAQLLKDIQPLISSQTAVTANESGNSIVITDTQCNIHRVAEVIKAIDSSAEDVTVVRIFHLAHANPSEMSDLLTSLFPDDSRSGSSQTPIAFGGPGGGGFRRFFAGFGGPPPGMGRPGGNSSNGSQNQRIKKRARVISVPDQRTSSVVVTAAKDLMDQISQVVDELDSDRSNLKAVAVFRLENAEPQDALQVLQDIFQKSGTQNNRNTQNQNNALQSRSTQQTQQYNNNRNNTSRTSQMGRGGMSFGQ